MNVALTKEDLERAQEFAERQLSTSSLAEYKRRGSTSHKKITEQIVVGKLAEIAVSEVLGGAFAPSFDVLEREDKSYDADIKVGGVRFHVKGQSTEQARKYGTSWLFQRWDDVVQSPSHLDVVVPCAVDLKSLQVEVFGFFAASRLKFGYPKAPKMAATKVALYLEDIYADHKTETENE